MSIDLEWNSLNSSLSSRLVEILNRQLSSTPRPSFIGPVEVTSLEFGSVAPDVELVDLRDIYRDFLEDDEEESEKDPVKVTEGADDDDGFEWVSRKAARKEEGLAYQQLSPHMRYPGRGDMFASVPILPSHMDMFHPGLMDFRSPYTASWPYPSAESRTPLDPIPQNRPIPFADSVSLEEEQPEPQKQHPNLQLHFQINWHSNLRITLTTSLLINYPSPMFMSLPIKLSVTGLIFTGEIAVAYEGERGRVHFCILDDLDPYGPTGDRPKRDSTDSTPPELDDDSPNPGILSRPPKPLPMGQRLLPSIYIESEIGQADKHVLKNVTRVERFIQDVIRKTVEEELVFPNFHTLVMAEQ